jgi:phage baseplate assembly protein V
MDAMGALSDQQQNLSNQIRLGTVAELDLAGALCRVQTGEILTDFLPWLVPAAGKVIVWSAPSVGEQVVVLSPEGDTTSAVVLRGLYSDAFASPSSSADAHAIRFPDGAQVAYDSARHTLGVMLPSGGTAIITADGGLTINGPLTINGDVKIAGDATVSGKATASSDVIGGGISLKSHKHGGVTSGSAISGAPQ